MLCPTNFGSFVPGTDIVSEAELVALVAAIQFFEGEAASTL